MGYNVLYVIDNLEYGGGERGFAQIIHGVDKAKFNVYVACNPRGEFGNKIEALGLKLDNVNMKSRLNPFTILQLARVLRKRGIHIVHSQGARVDFFVRVAAQMVHPKPKIVSTIQMPVKGFDIGVFRKKIYQKMDHFLERNVERFIVVSESLKNFLFEKRAIPIKRIVKIYNGVELGQYHPITEGGNLREELGITQGVPLIGGVGRMVWQKGFEYLIDAVPEIVTNVPEAKFLMVGEGELKDKLKIKSEKLQVRDKIIFTGFRSDIKEILSIIDVLVVPSVLEGFPMLTLEGMAMAKPIIATNIDGINEQITDGEDGILVPVKDFHALSKAIVKVLKDEEGMKNMGLAARKKVEREFSVDRMVAKTEKVYLSVLQENQKVSCGDL